MKGKVLENNKYTVESVVTSFEVDNASRMRPTAFMDLAQEMAYQESDVMGFGFDDLKKSGTAWVISRMHIVFHKMPLWKDEFAISTWHKRLYGPFFLRDFDLKDKDGNVLISATTSWLVINTTERRMARSEDVAKMIPEDSTCQEDAVPEPAGKVVLPKGAMTEYCGSHVVEYSDIDVVGHSNNARYVAWAMDCIEYDKLIDSPIKDLQIAFNHETRIGDKINLFRCIDGDAYYIEGRLADKQVFCVRIAL